MRRRAADPWWVPAAACALVAALLLPVLPACAFAQQTAPAELVGRVVRGATIENDSAGGEGVADVEVELHRVTADGGSVVDSTVSGPDGGFRFALADDEARPLYLAAVSYEGVRYFGPALHPGMSMDEEYRVAVYDTTVVTEAPPSGLRVGVRHVVVTPAPQGGIDVAEVIDVIGPEDRTLVPASDTLVLWSTALPNDARDAQAIEGGAPADEIRFTDGRVRLASMVTPVGVRVTYTYRVDGDEIELPVEHPTDRVEVVVAGAEAEVEGASHAETTTRAGRLIHRYEGTALKPGQAIRVRLVGEGGGGIDRWALIWAAIGVALLGAAGGLALTGRSAS